MIMLLQRLFGMEVSLWIIALTIGGGLTMALAPTVRNVRLAHPFFAMATIWSLGCTFEWLADGVGTPMKYVWAFVIGGGIFALSLAAFGWVEGNHAEHLEGQTPPPNASTPALPSPQRGQTEKQSGTRNNQQEQNNAGGTNNQQSSSGSNSPNVNIVGNGARVTITAAPQPKLEGFHEKVEQVSFSFGNGMKDVETVERLRKEIYEPFDFGGFIPVSLHMKNDVFLFSFKVWGGPGKPPIEIKNNEFVVRDVGDDRNSSANALEIIDANGNPLFQMIRETPTDIVVNGVFPVPHLRGPIIAGPDGVITGASPSDLAAFKLKPIFKYPSWKYPGKYADDK